MVTINTISGSALAQAATTPSAQKQSSQDAGEAFGSATNVTLSPTAQAAVTGQGNISSTTPSAPAPAAPPAVKGAPSVPISTTSTTTDTATLIQEALQQVIPKVGITNASEVVNAQGNIDQVKLQELITQQNQAPTTTLTA